MDRAARPRPPVFRALGNKDPHETLVVDGDTYTRQDIYKHDSWAATARYRCGSREIVCKLNRTQSIGLIPMKWLGRFLARRESFAYEQLQGLSGIAPMCREIKHENTTLPHAAGHDFIAGHPLQEREMVKDHFFPQLLNLLREVHSRGFAYVDLHKRENILVSDLGEPYLIDFQISFYSPQSWLAKLTGRTILLHLLQQSDLYHLTKHILRIRPDQIELLGLKSYAEKPWWIRAHRKVAVPFRQTRRWLLSKIGVRGKSGRSSSEVFAEHAFREDNQKKAA